MAKSLNVTLEIGALKNKIKRLNTTLKEENSEKKLGQQCRLIEKDFYSVETIFWDSEEIEKGLSVGINQKIYRLIRSHDLKGVTFMFEIGQSLYENGVDINHCPGKAGTFLWFAISEGQTDIAEKLLKAGADPNKRARRQSSPLEIAIRKQNVKSIQLLIDFGADVNSPNPTYPLATAIKCHHFEGVKLLIKNGAKIYLDKQNQLYGETSHYSSPLTVALKENQFEIAVFLLDIILASAQLLQKHLYLFLLNAPLSMLHDFIVNDALSPLLKFTTKLITWTRRTGKESSIQSGELLLRLLLQDSAQIEERLIVLQQLILQLTRLEYMPASLEEESCYAGFSLIKAAANETEDTPKKHLANRLDKSMRFDEMQGRVGVAVRLFRMVIHPLFPNAAFLSGLDLIKEVKKQLHQYKCQHGDWPSQAWIENFLENWESHTQPQLVASHALIKKKNRSPDANRFLAMAGSKAFEKYNDNLLAGGIAEDAACWYGDFIASILIDFQNCHLLKSSWNEKKIKSLLMEMAGKPVIFNKEQTTTMGMDFNLSNHFIPIILHQEKTHWLYTIMCRGFIQPEKERVSGATDFIVADEQIEKVVAATKFSRQNFSAEEYENPYAVDRNIDYQLFMHFHMLEKIIGKPGFYSDRLGQKPYVTKTCYASNFKPFLVFFLEKMVNHQNIYDWGIFVEKMRALIVAEMEKQNLFLENEETFQVRTKTEVTYKLMTCLLRWQEINRFQPSTPNEIKGKNATIKHVAAMTKKRMSLRFDFCNRVPNETPLENSQPTAFYTNSH